MCLWCPVDMQLSLCNPGPHVDRQTGSVQWLNRGPGRNGHSAWGSSDFDQPGNLQLKTQGSLKEAPKSPSGPPEGAASLCQLPSGTQTRPPAASAGPHKMSRKGQSTTVCSQVLAAEDRNRK